MLFRRLLPALPYLLLMWVWWQGWGSPALEDDRFWWIPQALDVYERGPVLIPAGPLPKVLLPEGISPLQVPPQWSGGIPDYAHPPLFYWYLASWMKLLGPSMHSIQLGLLVLALLGMVGFQRLVLRVTSPAWAVGGGLLLPLIPVISVQLSRADLDMALFCLTPWALDALLGRRYLRFMGLSMLAVWCKEPGVLLAAAVLPCIWQERGGRRWLALLAMLSPLGSLLAWGLLHWWLTGWGLAGTERLPSTLWGWIRDLQQVAQLVLLEQGRFWLLPCLVAAAWRLWRARSLPLLILGLHLLTHLAFFGTVNFLGGDPNRIAGGHLRYLIPAWISFLALCLAGSVPLQEFAHQLLARLLSPWRQLTSQYMTSLLWGLCAIFAWSDWHAPPIGGVERNFFAHDLVSAHQRLLPKMAQALQARRQVWVGSYAWIELSLPILAGDTNTIEGLKWYGQSTQPDELPIGAWVLVSAHGEPLGVLEHALELKPLERVNVGSAWAELREVVGHHQPPSRRE